MKIKIGVNKIYNSTLSCGGQCRLVEPRSISVGRDNDANPNGKIRDNKIFNSALSCGSQPLGPWSITDGREWRNDDNPTVRVINGQSEVILYSMVIRLSNYFGPYYSDNSYDHLLFHDASSVGLKMSFSKRLGAPETHFNMSFEQNGYVT